MAVYKRVYQSGRIAYGIRYWINGREIKEIVGPSPCSLRRNYEFRLH